MFYQYIETRKVVKDLGKTGIASVTDPRMPLSIFSQADIMFPGMTEWYLRIIWTLFPCVYREAESASHKRVKQGLNWAVVSKFIILGSVTKYMIFLLKKKWIA